MFCVKGLYGVLEYTFNIFNRSVVSVVWKITQMNFDVICMYIEVFNMVYGVLILYVLHINDLHVFVHLVYSHQYLVSCIINIV